VNQFSCASHLAEYLMFSAHLEMTAENRWIDNHDGSYGVSTDVFGGLSSSFDHRMPDQMFSLQFHLLCNDEWDVILGDLRGK
jgi:hypothetical protein